jgi:NADP-dependent 3-hydroxy acid dehydrogenase YdfG
MSGLSGKIVLITGASSGIGAGTATHFASLHCKLSLVARNLDNLNKVAEECREAGAEEVIVLSKDLSVTEQCVAAVEETVAHFKGIGRFV